MGGIERIYNLYSIYGLIGNGCQKLWNFMDQNTINASLHGEKMVVINALPLNCLVD